MPQVVNKKAKVEPLLIRAQFEPTTFSEESRTVEVTFATETPVRRYDWLNDRYFDEVLSLVPGHMRTERLDAGAPLLDNHSTYAGVRNTLGVVEGYSLQGNVARATVRFSKREEVEGILQDVKDGILRNISVGYKVHKYEKEMRETDVPVYRAVDWEPFEISLVSVPADPNSGVRSAEGKEFTEVTLEGEEPDSQIRSQQTIKSESIMKREQIIAMLAKRGITVDANISDEALNAELERALTTSGEDPEAVRNAAIEAERKRSADIMTAVRSAKLPVEFAETLISEGKSVDQARAAIIEEFAKQDPNAGTRSQHIHVGEDRSEAMRRSATEAALVMRGAPEVANGKNAPYSEDVKKEAHKLRGMSLVDLAKDSLVRGGVNVDGMDKMEIVGRAFTSSSSDFPVLLEGANRTVLLASYEAQADTWRRFCATGSVSDFREHKRLRMGSFGDLEKLNENGEYKTKKITDADFEKVSIDTKGNIINVSRKMIINDDLGAFLKLASMLGRSAARSIENDVYALLASNPVLADGVALFHANHNNLVTGAAPTIAVIEAMRQKMAQQKDKDKNDFLDIRPSIALAPMAIGSTLRLLNNSQYDNDGSAFQKPNIVAGLFRDVIDTPRLSGNAYYMFADPNEEPVIEVNFLNGEQNPHMENEEGFTVDGMKWKIRLDYGVGAVGFRGAIKNPGA